MKRQRTSAMSTVSNSQRFPWRAGRLLQALFVSAAFLATSSCKQSGPAAAPQPPAKEVMARVGNAVIDSKTYENELARRSRMAPGRYTMLEQRRELLEEMIREKVLLERAREAGYGQRPELVRRFEQIIVAQYQEDHPIDAATLPAPTDAEIEAWYGAHSAEFSRPEKFHFAVLQLKGSTNATAAKQAELRQRAQDLRTEASNLPGSELTFGHLARRYSDDAATRYKGGDGGWIERGRTADAWPAPITDALFALSQPGEISPVVAANGSCYLLKLIERKPAGARPLGEVREWIAHRLAQERKQQAERQFHEQQRAGMRIEINQPALARVPAPEPAVARTQARPPSVPSR